MSRLRSPSSRPRSLSRSAWMAAALAAGWSAGPAVAGPARVLVLMKEFAGAAADAAVPRAARRRGVIEGRRASLRAGMRRLGLGPRVESDARELWVAGAFAVTADDDLRRRLAADPAVRAVIPDAPVEPPRVFPSAAKPPGDAPVTWGLARIRVPAVWRRYWLRGEGQRIGVIDTGVDAAHPDLAGKVAAYRNFASGNQVPGDDSGHGTHVAGTLVGGAASGTAIGVAPAAELLVARGFGGADGGREALLAGMQWMLDPDGDPATDDAPGVVSMSWHSGPRNQEPFFRAVDTFLAADIFPCFSAGNMGPDGWVSNPKKYPPARSTGAVDDGDEVARFSSRGPEVYKGKTIRKPDFSAPGADIFSARPGGTWIHKSGTSMAAPHTAGVVALLRQAAPGRTVPELVEVLQTTGVDLGETGWDPAYGHGRIDALAAVEAVATVGTREVRVTGPGGAPAPWPAVEVAGSGVRFAGRDGGPLTLRLPPGRYDLTVSAFGHVAARRAVVIGAGDGEPVAVELAATPVAESVVRVRSADERPLEGAAVRWLETPRPPVVPGADGRAAATLPAGRYLALVTADGRAPVTVGVRVPGPPREVSLRRRAEVLLVDDDLGEKYDRFVEDAFTDAGVAFDVWDRTYRALDYETLREYPLVVWMCGDDSRDTFVKADQALVKRYLDDGGGLLVTGQDVGYDHKTTDFLRYTLHVWFHRDNSKNWRVDGLDMAFEIDGGDGASNQDAPDEIGGMSGGKVILEYPGEWPRPAAIRYKNSLVVLGFGLEAVTPLAKRSELLVRLLAILRGESHPKAAAAYRRRRARREGFNGSPPSPPR